MDITFRDNVESSCLTLPPVLPTGMFPTGIVTLRGFVRTSRSSYVATRLMLRFVIIHYISQWLLINLDIFVGAQGRHWRCHLPPKEKPPVLRNFGEVEL